MKHIIKVESLQNLPSTRPLIAMDNNGNLFVEGEVRASDFINLELQSGLKWRKYNLGANSITDYGNYYQWGDIASLNVTGTTVDPAANWDNYKYYENGQITKYTDNNSSTLLPEDDAATVQNTSWRMPSKDNFIELAALPNKWMSVNGVNGRVFCKANEPGAIQGDFSIMEEGLYLYDENNPNPDSESGAYNIYDDFDPIGLEYQTEQEVNATLTAYYAENYRYEGTVDINTMLFLDDIHETLAQSGSDYQLGSFPQFNENTMLFIPAAGYCNRSELYNAGHEADYWSSSLQIDFPDSAFYLNFSSYYINPENYNNRYCGFSVRPVSQ